MSNNSNQYEHYELLNLLGYKLVKFNNNFIKQFGFKAKEHSYQYFVNLNISKTKNVIKNRQDLFDPYFNHERLDWWQKKRCQ